MASWNNVALWSNPQRAARARGRGGPQGPWYKRRPRADTGRVQALGSLIVDAGGRFRALGCTGFMYSFYGTKAIFKSYFFAQPSLPGEKGPFQSDLLTSLPRQRNWQCECANLNCRSDTPVHPCGPLSLQTSQCLHWDMHKPTLEFFFILLKKFGPIGPMGVSREPFQKTVGPTLDPLGPTGVSPEPFQKTVGPTIVPGGYIAVPLETSPESSLMGRVLTVRLHPSLPGGEGVVGDWVYVLILRHKSYF